MGLTVALAGGLGLGEDIEAIYLDNAFVRL